MDGAAPGHGKPERAAPDLFRTPSADGEASVDLAEAARLLHLARMTLKACVRNGVIELPTGTVLPEGVELEIALPDAQVLAPVVQDDAPGSFYEDIREFIGCLEGAPSDLAENHDHYAHGAPKGIDRL